MRNSIIIGKIKGIEIELNFSWFVIFGIVTFTLATSFFPSNYPEWGGLIKWGLAAGMAIMLFVSVLLHELSHSLVSKGLGIDVKKISLFIFGGIAQIEKEPDEPVKELKIAIAGPLMSLAIGITALVAAIFLRSLGVSEIVTVPLVYIYSVNFILAVFNMVPAFPLDGGRVLRAIIWKVKGDLKTATKIASASGSVFGYMLIFLGVFLALTGNWINGIWFVFIGWFINQASQTSYQNMIMADMFGKIRVREFMSKNVVAVDSRISLRDMVDSYIYRYKYSSFPVVKSGAVVGIISIDKIRNTDKNLWETTTVEEAAEKLKDNIAVSSEDTVTEAMGKLFQNGIGRVLVVDDGELVGIVSRTDILNHIRIYNKLH